MFDLEQFYDEQLIILKQENIEPIVFYDKLVEVLDRLGMLYYVMKIYLEK